MYKWRPCIFGLFYHRPHHHPMATSRPLALPLKNHILRCQTPLPLLGKHFSKASFSKSFIGTHIPVHFRFSYSSWKNLVYHLVHICTEAIQYIQMLSNVIKLSSVGSLRVDIHSSRTHQPMGAIPNSIISKRQR